MRARGAGGTPVLALRSVALPDIEGWDALYAIRSLADRLRDLVLDALGR